MDYYNICYRFTAEEGNQRGNEAVEIILCKFSSNFFETVLPKFNPVRPKLYVMSDDS